MMAALRRDGAWDSALSVGGFAAIRSVGFEPAGQVFGACVYYLSATAGVSCPGNAARHLARDASPEAPGTSPATVPGQGIPGPAARIAQALYDGRRTAIDRMAGECADLGGHGIVGAALQVREIPVACDLSGPDFARLLMAGWVPAGIALGISVAGLHDDLLTTSSGPWGTGNAEVPAYTNLVVQVRQDARSRLEQAVRGLGADGVVVSAMTLHVRSDACRAHPGGTDHFAEAVITGTAVARFADRRKTALPPSLTVLSLDAGGAGHRADRDRGSRSAVRQPKTRSARPPATGTSTPGAYPDQDAEKILASIHRAKSKQALLRTAKDH